jgi:hypothetical protein
MRRIIVTAALALAAIVGFSVPALAHGGGDRDGDRHRGRGHDRVCQWFVVKGTVDEVASRAVLVTVQLGWPDELVGDQVELHTGSRTRVDGEVVPGARLKAHGVVCQLDEADAPVYYTQRAKVKAERPAKGSFDLIGEVTAVDDDAVEIEVGDANVPSLVGRTVRLGLGGGTEVQGELEVGALVSASGRLRGSTLNATLVVVERPAADVVE